MSSTNRLIVRDRKMGIRYLIDTGADISVLPKAILSTKKSPEQAKLYAANGTSIKTFDIANKRLVDGTTELYAPGQLSNVPLPMLSIIDKSDKFHKLLEEFIDVTKPCPIKEGVHDIKHHIITKGNPVVEKARRLPPNKYKAAKESIEEMIRNGIYQPSSSNWSSPIHLVDNSYEEAHERHLTLVLTRLREYGLSINYEKCSFAKEEIEYIGYHISGEGTKPLPNRVEAIKNYKRPENIQELRRFLGITDFYRRFIKNAAHAQAPLNAYLIGSKKRDKRKILWTDEAIDAFEKCKQQLSDACLLVHPKQEATLAL
ncbi:hypothetical protein KPH14_001014 [Odynerus spinipes]|uniref:RNA-directed DNA polymerase n=1 Tax=Odynerus spinipes TaxID=1348599 RepID=A0AAD9RCB5_9HYME|nr:hypothetical protein KPH14_001014 [Odynerus spinipes]